MVIKLLEIHCIKFSLLTLALDFEPVRDLMTSGLSDHGGLKIKLTGIPDKAWFKRIKIPNKKIGQ